jgi:signal transduction histidine kinase
LWSPAIDPPATLPPPPLSRLALWPQTLTLFAQTLGLTILTLLSAIIITVIVIFNLPPPMPDFYRVADIAQVLKTGRPFTGAERPPLVRTISNAPPVGAEIVRGDMMYLTRQELAHRLNTDPQDVLVMMDSPRFTDRKAVALIRGQMARAGPGQDRFLIAPFMVSVKQPNGQWFSVAPTPSFKLSAWQSRLLLWLGLSLLALIPLAYLFSLRLSSPIAAFAAAAERLGRDPRAPPLAIKGPSEIGVAVKAVNEMQQRLARYVDDRTAMIGAIAHDLRTPLTRLRFRLEDAPDPVRRKMAADISEMEAMIAAAIAFVRDATTPTARTKLELSSLLESLADEMSETGLDVVVDVSERVVIDGDPVGLRRLFNNLLGNAVKFAGGARVRVTAGVEAAVVEIEDDGLGLPENELERVFEPFYRCEQSRSRESGGIGLGLPVVRSIARAHGGDAVLSNRPTHGLIATVTLPLAGV